MDYLIDGYNLLFRVVSGLGKLQSERDGLIEDLNQKAALLGLNFIVVFDALNQYGGATRAHYRHLEIVFTSWGVTADDHILADIHRHRNPKEVTVVTSDNRLAWRARHAGAKTESVDHFLKWLRKRYYKRLHPLPPKPSKSPPSPQPEAEELLPSAPRLDYLEIFEQRLKLAEEESGQKPPPPAYKDEAQSDYERWLRAFENKIKGSD